MDRSYWSATYDIIQIGHRFGYFCPVGIYSFHFGHYYQKEHTEFINRHKANSFLETRFYHEKRKALSTRSAGLLDIIIFTFRNYRRFIFWFGKMLLSEIAFLDCAVDVAFGIPLCGVIPLIVYFFTLAKTNADLDKGPLEINRKRYKGQSLLF